MNIQTTIRAIVVLDLNGKRLLAKYHDDKINSKQFEREIFNRTKTHKTRNELLVLDNYIILHRCISSLHMYVVGGSTTYDENPLILDRVLCCLVETVTTLINRSTDNPTVFDCLDQIILAFDEICDEGVVLEIDPSLVLERVCLRAGVADQSMAQVLQNATEHIRFPWIRS